MRPNYQSQKPEAALQRAHEFISVGKQKDALQSLHDLIKVGNFFFFLSVWDDNYNYMYRRIDVINNGRRPTSR